MELSELLDLPRRLLRGALMSLWDSLPPYKVYEGPLGAKATSPEGKSFIRLGVDMVEVDGVTFDALEVGETLWVRYTRGNKAINIDRLLDGHPRSGAT